MVFFEPPCTIVLSQRSEARLKQMGYLVPGALAKEGVRLEGPGDRRSMSFAGYEPFSVLVGVCPLDAASAVQTAQLWATVRFDGVPEWPAGVGGAGGSDGAAGVPEEGGLPDESALVQSWKSGRATFGKRPGTRVRLTFSYPDAEHAMADVYELDIRYEGYYQVAGLERKRTHRTSTMTTLTSLL